MKPRKSVAQAFGKERAALNQAEIQQLAEGNYDEKDLVNFMELYAAPTGASCTLSMFRQSKLSINDLKEALDFLYNPAPTITRTLHDTLPLGSRLLEFG